MSEAAEVRRTLHAYCTLMDEGRLAELVARVYSEDAVDDRHRGEPLRGRQQIHDYFARAQPHLRATVHLLANVDVTIDPGGQAAVASSRVLAMHWNEPATSDSSGAADFILVGRYSDELQRGSEGWQIVRRTVDALGPNGLAVGVLPAVFAGFGGKT